MKHDDHHDLEKDFAQVHSSKIEYSLDDHSYKLKDDHYDESNRNLHVKQWYSY